MKKIHCLKDIKDIECEYPKVFIDYIEEEFLHIYEYLSNGEKIEDFKLFHFESIVLLDDEKELKKILRNQVELEFVEELELKTISITRIGLMKFNAIQLCYYLKLRN